MDRFGLVDLLDGFELVGVELGVASGDFSKRMVESGRFAQFFGVDAYADHHDINEYVGALKSIGLFSSYKLLRMRFDEALALFPDESLDFVYVDGYAHTGEERGATIFSWLSKVRVGGVIAGHDYHSDWPLVMEAVDELSRQTGFELMITGYTPNPGPQDDYPSWAIVKSRSVPVAVAGGGRENVRNVPSRDLMNEPFRRRVKGAFKLLMGAKGVDLLRSLMRLHI